MSSSSVDISSGLIDGIYSVLNGNVTISGVTYKVYKNFYKGPTNRSYVMIGNVIDNDNGTKDDFVYEGSIAIECVYETQPMNPQRATVQAINNKVRSLLKTTKTEVPSVTDRTVVIFRHGGSTMREEQTRDKRTRYVITDIYEFIIQ